MRGRPAESSSILDLMRRLGSIVVLGCLGLACGSGSSRVVVRVSTDVDATQNLRVTLRVAAGSDTASACDTTAARPAYTLSTNQSWRAGGTPLEAQVSIQSGDRVRVGICVYHGSDAPWERVATFGFAEARDLLLPLTINGDCLQLVSTCASPAQCPYGQYCGELMQTCGNDGRCGAIAVTQFLPYTGP